MPVVALSQVNCEELESVFHQEIKCWQSELFWDYQPAIALIKKYIASGSLPGYAIRIPAGPVLGYCYYIINEPVGYIGNMYVLSESADPATYAKLLNQILGKLESDKKIRRIEGQLFAFNCDLVPLFKDRQFNVIKRHFLSRTIDSVNDSRQRPASPAAVRLVKWQEKFCNGAAEAIYDSYHGSPDYSLCHDYQSRQGCTRFLRNLVDNPGCGIFSPETSLVALDSNEIVCGVLMASTIDPGTGMIPQISVRRSHQERGIGSLLLKTYFREAGKHGIERVTLSVSGMNHRAHQLYLRLGFDRIRDFHAFTRP